MIPDLNEKLRQYTEDFNREDEEIHPSMIPNKDAFEWLAPRIPHLDCPDRIVERTYYYRWWILRRHWISTPYGHILTEFSPLVGWAGAFNSINAALGHHVREARWMNDPEAWTKEYISFFLDRRGNSLSYSTWYASLVRDWLKLHPDPAFEAECVDKLVSLYEDREKTNLHPCGLFWSQDGWDAMEESISGSGIRPTMNSYMIGDAEAISLMAARAGRYGLAERFADKAAALREKMNLLLWDGDFYKVIPCGRDEEFPAENRPSVPKERSVREELGYIPWYFGIPGPEKSDAFRFLTDERGFRAPFGITTAERSHPRFMYEHPHECLWNGPVWPYATSQTLTGLANHLRAHGEAGITKADYYALLRQYAASHRLRTDDGREIMWIDEDMDPFTGDWTARTILKADDWNHGRNVKERGKDYNHSTFCDLVLSGLLGIDARDGRLTADPLIPDNWDGFCVTNLPPCGQTILFDRTGNKYGLGAGIHILDPAPEN